MCLISLWILKRWVQSKYFKIQRYVKFTYLTSELAKLGKIIYNHLMKVPPLAYKLSMMFFCCRSMCNRLLFASFYVTMPTFKNKTFRNVFFLWWILVRLLMSENMKESKTWLHIWPLQSIQRRKMPHGFSIYISQCTWIPNNTENIFI